MVPLGTDGESEPTPAAVSEVKSRYHLPDEYCLYLGTIEPRKNIPALIRSWDSIAADSACDLVIAGREGWKTRTFRDALQRATHRDRIHVLGFVPEADRVPLMAGAAVFVWPSLYEGFGLPPLDAMALGTPVLTSDTSSMPEVCENAALLVDPHDENSIATGLQQILSDDKLRDQLEHAGRDRAHRLSWSRTVEYTIDAYQRALRMRR